MSLLAVSLVTGCATAKKTEAPPEAPPPPVGLAVVPYFPLQVGNQWVYRGSHLGDVFEQTITILGRDGPWFVDSKGERFLIDAEGLRSADRYLLRGPISPGNAWSSVVSLATTEHYEITEVGVTASVPAGRFHGCARVLGRIRLDGTTKLFKADTYCPGVGLVRMRTWLDAAGRGRIPQGEIELHRFDLVNAG